MPVSLLQPMALLALAALLVPLLIHLARRNTEQPLMFTALRWLQSQPKPRRRLRFTDWPLLLLRLLLLTVLALWLAQPLWHGIRDPQPLLAVMSGISAAQGMALAQPSNTRRIWLAEGFPTLDAPVPAGPHPTASLLRQLDAELPPGARLTVLATSTFDGADAQRPRMSRKVDWRVIAASPAPATPWVRPPSPRLHVFVDASHRDGARYLQAADQAWHGAPNPLPLHAAGDALPVGRQAHLAWLQAGQLPPQLLAWVERGGTALLAHDAALPAALPATPVWPDADGRWLATAARLGQGRLVQLRQPLQPQAWPFLLDGRFPGQLRAALQDAPPLPARASASAYSPLTGAAPPQPPLQTLQPWLALLAALLFLLERWRATRLRPGAP